MYFMKMADEIRPKSLLRDKTQIPLLTIGVTALLLGGVIATYNWHRDGKSLIIERHDRTKTVEPELHSNLQPSLQSQQESKSLAIRSVLLIDGTGGAARAEQLW